MVQGLGPLHLDFHRHMSFRAQQTIKMERCMGWALFLLFYYLSSCCSSGWLLVTRCAQPSWLTNHDPGSCSHSFFPPFLSLPPQFSLSHCLWLYCAWTLWLRASSVGAVQSDWPEQEKMVRCSQPLLASPQWIPNVCCCCCCVLSLSRSLSVSVCLSLLFWRAGDYSESRFGSAKWCEQTKSKPKSTGNSGF